MGRVCAATPSDAVLYQPMRLGLGYMAKTGNRASGGDSVIMGESAFDHVGWAAASALLIQRRG